VPPDSVKDAPRKNAHVAKLFFKIMPTVERAAKNQKLDTAKAHEEYGPAAEVRHVAAQRSFSG